MSVMSKFVLIDSVKGVTPLIGIIPICNSSVSKWTVVKLHAMGAPRILCIINGIMLLCINPESIATTLHPHSAH